MGNAQPKFDPTLLYHRVSKVVAGSEPKRFKKPSLYFAHDDLWEYLKTVLEPWILKELAFLVRLYFGCHHCDQPCCSTLCSYCGLPKSHHYNNRPFVPIGIPCLYSDRYITDARGNLFYPQKYYCSLRCPLERCRSCSNVFVFVGKPYCVACYVRMKNKVLSRVEEKEEWRVDEMVQYGLMETLPIHVQCVGLHGYKYQYVHDEDVKPIIRTFLDTLERFCVCCQLRFRYASDKDLLWCDQKKGFLCGFCAHAND